MPRPGLASGPPGGGADGEAASGVGGKLAYTRSQLLATLLDVHGNSISLRWGIL